MALEIDFSAFSSAAQDLGGGSRLVPTALLMTLKVLRWLYNPHVMSGCGGSAWDHEKSFTGAPVSHAPF